MTTLKLTKTQLREEQGRLTQLEKYLPVLQLKKSLLQSEVSHAKEIFREKLKEQTERYHFVEKFSKLLTETDANLVISTLDATVTKGVENIAGVDLPTLDKVQFPKEKYSLYSSAPWVDTAVSMMQKWLMSKYEADVARVRTELLEKELREVSIRVNLFDKILIPKAKQNIRKIKIFLGDQQLAAISQSKIAKTKILKREGGEA